MKPKSPAPPSAPLAFSYIRFSSREQAKGDSLRRQSDATAEWCQRNGVTLDGSATFRDLGKSAFLGEHRKNPDRHALASFLKMVEEDRVPRGSYLIIENLDRLSREQIQPAMLLALGLLQAGIRIVQLKPAEMVFDDKSDSLSIMMMMVELSRGHSESAMKSQRIGEAWERRRQRARETGALLTRQLPAWLTADEKNGRPRIIPERAAVVKRIFRLAVEGYGIKATIARLVADKVPPFGTRSKAGNGAPSRWSSVYVSLILRDRRALGEYQPRRSKDDQPLGPPIPNYYPAVVTEAEWLAARAGAAQRLSRPIRANERGGFRGRATGAGGFVNVFSGLVRDARTGGTFQSRHNKPSNGRGWSAHVLVNSNAMMGSEPFISFPYTTFEQAVLGLLKEIDPRDILPPDDPAAAKATNLAAQLAGADAELTQASAWMEENGFSPAIAGRIAKLEAQRKELAADLTTARASATMPAVATWADQTTLIDALDQSPDPQAARLRLRSLLRRTVENIWVLVVRRGADRLCYAQVYFAEGGQYRSYLICHRAERANGKTRTPSRWCARSYSDVIGAETPLLREPKLTADGRSETAIYLEAALRTIPLEEIEKPPTPPADAGHAPKAAKRPAKAKR